MTGYPSIGAIYLLREQNGTKSRLWAVIENNSNDGSSTISLVEDCKERGKIVKVDAKWLYEREPVGPILPPAGEIVIEDGKEFVRPTKEKVQSKALKYQ